ETRDTRSRIDRGEYPELQKRRHDRNHEYVDVRPSSDEVDEAIECSTLPQQPGRAEPDRDQEPAQPGELQYRHEDRGEQDKERQSRAIRVGVRGTARATPE